MGKSLKDMMGNKNKARNDGINMNEIPKDFNPADVDYVRESLSKYEGKDEDELISELSKVAKESKEKGELDDKKLDQIAGQMAPMLDAGQREKMLSLINMLKK